MATHPVERSVAVEKSVVYEQPLNERIRTFLRLEYLFAEAAHAMQGDTEWDSRASISTLLDVVSIFGRTDLKTEILKELERHTVNLARLEQNPNVDRSRLGHILDELDVLIDRLHTLNGGVGQQLRKNEFLCSIRQRSSIAGGTCDFDLPIYHHWLQKPAKARKQDLLDWWREFEPISEAVTLILRLIRESTPPRLTVAHNGFYQSSLDANIPYQLIRITLQQGSPHFAEISAGKHRFTVRFMHAAIAAERPTQATDDVEFALACCVI